MDLYLVASTKSMTSKMKVPPALPKKKKKEKIHAHTIGFIVVRMI